MMKQQIRIIRISFCICAALAIGAFWAGFYFGNTQLQTEQQIADGSSGIYTAEADIAERRTEKSPKAIWKIRWRV